MQPDPKWPHHRDWNQIRERMPVKNVGKTAKKTKGTSFTGPPCMDNPPASINLLITAMLSPRSLFCSLRIDLGKLLQFFQKNSGPDLCACNVESLLEESFLQFSWPLLCYHTL